MIRNIDVNLDDFHPMLRERFRKEFERLTENYPLPFKISVYVANDYKDYPCSCGKCDHQKEEFKSIAATRVNILDKVYEIFFKADLYGVNGDLKKLDDELSINMVRPDWFGGLKDPVSVLSHEYGHCIDYFIRDEYEFEKLLSLEDGEDTRLDHKPVLRAYRRLVGEVAETLTTHQMFEITLRMPVRYDLSKPRHFVSGYAYQNPHEFFAETFSFSHYGTEEQKNLPTVKLMNELIAEVFKDLKGRGKSKPLSRLFSLTARNSRTDGP